MKILYLHLYFTLLFVLSNSEECKRWDATQLSVTRIYKAIASVRDKVVVAGGTIDSSPTSLVEIYDVKKKTWKTEFALSTTFSQASALVVGDKIYIGPGYNQQYDCGNLNIYDARSDKWSTVTASFSCPCPSSTYTASIAFKSKLYYTGTYCGTSNPSNIIDIYDTETDTWSSATLSVARIQLSAFSYENRLYFAGGILGSSFSSTSRIDIYDSDLGRWITDELPLPLYLPWFSMNSAVVVKDTAYLLTSSPNNLVKYKFNNQTIETIPLKHNFNNIVALRNERLFLAGNTNITAIYDIKTGRWNETNVTRGISEITKSGNHIFMSGGHQDVYIFIDKCPKSTLSAGAIAGIFFAIFFLLIVVPLGIFFLLTKRKRTQLDKDKYHVFISHYQKADARLAELLESQLKKYIPRIEIFLDRKNLNKIHDLEKNVENSDNFLLILNEETLSRHWVQKEIEVAQKCKKRIILITDPMKGNTIIGELLNQYSQYEELLTNLAIEWPKDPIYYKTAVKKIEQQMDRSRLGFFYQYNPSIWKKEDNSSIPSCLNNK